MLVPRKNRRENGGMLGMGTLNNQPYIHVISRQYLLGPNPLLKVFGMFFSQSPLGPPCQGVF